MTTLTPQYLRELADSLVPTDYGEMYEIAKALNALADERERAVGGITEEVIRAACEAERDFLCGWKTSPGPTNGDTMRAALESAALALQPTEKLRALVESMDRQACINEGGATGTGWQKASEHWRDELSAIIGDSHE